MIQIAPHLEQTHKGVNLLCVSSKRMVNFKDQLQVLDSTYDHNFDIFEAYGFQSMLLM